ncbi:MAG: hypothetical protein P7H58_18690 [Microcoleus anatoxicus]
MKSDRACENEERSRFWRLRAIAVIALRELLFPYTAQASERLGNMTAV